MPCFEKALLPAPGCPALHFPGPQPGTVLLSGSFPLGGCGDFERRRTVSGSSRLRFPFPL